MKLYSYIVTHDTGFAPNPFHGLSTLACCKPSVRRSIGRAVTAAIEAKQSIGEYWIVGLSPRDRGRGNKVIFIMKVDKALAFDKYWNGYPGKQPKVESARWEERCGDNIYRPLKSGEFEQLPSFHSLNYAKQDWRPDREHMKTDLSGEYVLLSKHFLYFGSKAICLPNELKELIVGRGCRCNYENESEIHERFRKWVRTLKGGRKPYVPTSLRDREQPKKDCQ